MLEAHTITGAGDMWARVVARSNTDLQRVIDRVLETPAIVRSSTVIALATQVPYRVRPLARDGSAGSDSRPAMTAASSATFFISAASSVNSSRAGLTPTSVNSRSTTVRSAPQMSTRIRRR